MYSQQNQSGDSTINCNKYQLWDEWLLLFMIQPCVYTALDTHTGVERLVLAELRESAEQSGVHVSAQVFLRRFFGRSGFDYRCKQTRQIKDIKWFYKTLAMLYLQLGNMNLISLSAAGNDSLPWSAFFRCSVFCSKAFRFSFLKLRIGDLAREGFPMSDCIGASQSQGNDES